MSINELLLDWFGEKLPTLKDDYNWRVPLIRGFTLQHKTCYENTVALKKFMRDLWIRSDEDEKINIAKIIIGEWGGIKTNKKSTLEWYVQEIELEDPETPLHGVSSFSKLYSVIRPVEFAIYDARVAACLNSIQYNHKVKDGVIFNCNTSGRNSIIKEFFNMQKFKPKNLHERELWMRLPKDDTYRSYLYLLKSCLKEMRGYKLYDLEMALFHHSIDECVKAMEIARNKC